MKPFLLIFLCAFAAHAQFGLRSPEFVSKLNLQPPSAAGYFGGIVTTTGLISYWRMDESSTGSGAVTRVDSWSGYDLTDNGTTPSATGLISNAADCEDTIPEFLSRVDNPDLSLGTNVSFSITAWFKLESKPASSSTIIAKDNAASGGREYFILYLTSTDRIQFGIGRTGSVTGDTCNCTNSPAFSTNVWYFVAATFDPSINTMKISVNAGTQDSFGAKNIDPPDSSTAVNIGRRPAADLPFDGQIDEVSFWKNRVLSPTDISNLYNSGAGRSL